MADVSRRREGEKRVHVMRNVHWTEMEQSRWCVSLGTSEVNDKTQLNVVPHKHYETERLTAGLLGGEDVTIWDGGPSSLRRSLHASLHALGHNPTQARIAAIWGALVPLLVGESHGEADLVLRTAEAVAAQAERLGGTRRLVLDFALHHPKPTMGARLRVLRALALPLTTASAILMLTEAEVFLADVFRVGTIDDGVQLEALEWLRQLICTACASRALPPAIIPIALRLIPPVAHVTSHSSSAQLIAASLPSLELLVDAPGALVAGEGALVGAVCRAVNVRDGSKPAWRVMRRLLETAPEAAFGYLASLLVRASGGPSAPHVSLLRGAVFFMGMAVWGSQRVPVVAERLGPGSALPYLAHALAHCRHVLLAYEVGLCLRRCLRRHESALHAEWEDVLQIVEEFHRLLNVSRSAAPDAKQDLSALAEVVRDTIALLAREELLNSASVPRLRLYYVLELHAPLVPQAAIERLMAAKAPLLHPASERWQAQLKRFLHTFLVSEARPAVRLRALVEMKHLASECRWLHDEELAQLLLPHLEAAVHDSALLVALKGLEVTEALASQLPRESTAFPVLADLVLRVAQSGDERAVREAGVRALVSLFETKVEAPLSSAHALSLFLLLHRALALPDANLRRIPLQCLHRLRADPRGRISLDASSDHPAIVSPYLTCTLSSTPAQMTRLERAVLPLGQLAVVLVERLAAETSAALHDEVAASLKRMLLQTGAVAALDLSALAVQLLTALSTAATLPPFTELGKSKAEELRRNALDIFVRMLTYKRVLPAALRARLLTELRIAATDAPKLCPWHQLPLVATLVPRAFSRLLPTMLPAGAAYLRTLRSTGGGRSRGGSGKGMFDEVSSSHAVALLECLQMLAARTPPTLLAICGRATAKPITSLLADVLASRSFNPYARRLAADATGTWTPHLPPEARITLLQEIHALRSGGEGDEHAALLDGALDALHLRLPAPQPVVAATSVITPSLPEGQLPSIIFPASSHFAHWVHSGGLLSLRSGRYGWIQAVLRRPASCMSWYMHLHTPKIDPIVEIVPPLLTPPAAASPPALISPMPRNSSHASLLLMDAPVRPAAPTGPHSGTAADAILPLLPPLTLSSSPVSSPGLPVPAARSLLGVPTTFVGLGTSATPEDQISLESHRTAPPALLIAHPSVPLPPAPDALGWLTAHQPLPSYDMLDDPENLPSSPSPLPTLLSPKGSRRELLAADAPTEGSNSAPPASSIPQVPGSPTVTRTMPTSSLPSRSLSHSVATPPLTRSPYPRPTPSPNPGSTNSLLSASSPAVDSNKSSSVGSPTMISSPPRASSGGASFSPPTSPVAEDMQDDSLMAAFLHVYFLPLQPAPPLRCKGGEALERAVKVLDTVPVCATSRIGLIWVAEGQTKEEDFLANAHSSAPPRYLRFLSGLGQLLRLRGLPTDIFTGGLDYASDADGAYALFARDAGGQAVFHVATLMPPGRLADKKRHIGNDLVAIFYLERNPPVPETVAQADFDPETALPGQLTHVWLLVSPLPSQIFHRVEVRRRAGLAQLGPAAAVYILPDDTLAPAVRAIALNAHAAVELLLHKEGKASAPNVVERERQLRVIRERFAGGSAFEKGD